jgi:hypothetical protein
MGHTKGKTQPQVSVASVGRPPSGPRGERVSRYPQVTVRLPEGSKALLSALAGMTGMPAWKVVETALDAYVRALPADEQRVLKRVRARRTASGSR